MRLRHVQLVALALVLALGDVPSIALQARGVSARFDASTTAIDVGGHPVSIRARAVGRERGPATTLTGTDVVQRGGVVELRGASGIVEWWRATTRGLEHGITLSAAPSGEGLIVVDIATDTASVRLRSTTDAVFADASGAYARYAELDVRDARGRRLPAHFATHERHLRIVVDDHAAQYPVVIDPLLYGVQEAELTTASLDPNSRFGNAVGITSDGSRAIVGANGDNVGGTSGAGSIHVYSRVGTTWTEEAALYCLPLAGTATGCGTSVAISGDGTRAFVGNRSEAVGGRVRVFVRSGTSWTQETSLAAPTDVSGDAFGAMVATNSDASRVVVGAPGRDTSAGSNVGAAYVFLRTGTSWALEATLVQSSPQPNLLSPFGWDLSMSADGARVSAGIASDSTMGRQGSVRVFARTLSTWAEEATLADPSSTAGLGAGTSLSSDGSRLAANDRFGTLEVYVRTGTAWAFEAFVGFNTTSGYPVAISADGARILVGSTSAPANGSGDRSVALWSRTGTAWTLLAGPIYSTDGIPGASFGGALALSGDGQRAIIGAPNTTVGGNTSAGTAYVFTFASTQPNGSACTLSDRCASGFCADGVCCQSACGGGVTTDCQACTAAITGMPDGTCATAIGGTICHPYGGDCDPATACDGTSNACPASGILAAGTVCRPAVTPCDRAEVCDGTNGACPGDAFSASGVVCRAAAGACDVAETCSGTSAACPVDAFVAAGAACRAQAGACDIADTCDGASAGCIDRIQPAGAVCNALVQGVCDAPDVCDGVRAMCPPTFAAGTTCRATAGACDIAEACSGTSVDCPPDALLAAGHPCRVSTAACDPVELCDGSMASCPPDVNTCNPTPDGGVPDGATIDAAHADAQLADVSSTLDASTATPAPVGSCACRMHRAPTTGTCALALLALLALMGRRRAR